MQRCWSGWGGSRVQLYKSCRRRPLKAWPPSYVNSRLQHSHFTLDICTQPGIHSKCEDVWSSAVIIVLGPMHCRMESTEMNNVFLHPGFICKSLGHKVICPFSRLKKARGPTWSSVSFSSLSILLSLPCHIYYAYGIRIQIKPKYFYAHSINSYCRHELFLKRVLNICASSVLLKKVCW